MKTLIVRLTDETAARLVRAVPQAQKWMLETQLTDPPRPAHVEIDRLLSIGLDAADVEAEASAEAQNRSRFAASCVKNGL